MYVYAKYLHTAIMTTMSRAITGLYRTGGCLDADVAVGVGVTVDELQFCA